MSIESAECRKRHVTPVCFQSLSSELKVHILVEALSGVCPGTFLCDYRLLLCAIFSTDVIGLNFCIYRCSNETLRCVDDMRHAASQLTKLLCDRGFAKSIALDCLRKCCANPPRPPQEHSLWNVFVRAGVIVHSPTAYATPLRVHVVLYAAPRGKLHTTADVYTGMLVCFNLQRDCLHPLMINVDSICKTTNVHPPTSTFLKPQTERLLMNRNMGVHCCLLVVGKYFDGCAPFEQETPDGRKHTVLYYAIPETRRHVFDIWACWSEET